MSQRALATAAFALLGGAHSAMAVMVFDPATGGHDVAPDPLNLSRYVGQLGSFSGTPISSRYFVTAEHLGNGYTTFSYANGTSTTTNYSVSFVAHLDDLSLYKISDSDTRSFTLTAPLYTQSTEVGQPLVALGRGTFRGDPVVVNNQLVGWQWGNPSADLTWGTNTVGSVMTLGDSAISGPVIAFPFTNTGDPHTGSLSGGDSGGAIFVLDPADHTYKLAGVNSSVDGGFSYTANGPYFNAALFDARGLYNGDANTNQFIDPAMNPAPVPTSSYATQISSRVAFIKSTTGVVAIASWKPNAGGDWNTAGNWNAAVPNAVGAEADLLGAITAPHTLFTDSAITLGTLHFNSTSTYLITGTGALTMQSAAGPSLVEVEQGTQRIDLPTTVVGAASFSISSGASLVLNKLTVASASTATLVTGSLQIRTLSLASTAKFDVASNTLLIADDSAPSVSLIRSMLASGFNQGTWTGKGIVSTSASADARSLTALGYIDTGSGILIKYTYYGDNNLDGKVDTADFKLFLDGLATANASSWAQGDYTYDGKVDLGNDFNLFLSGYMMQGGALGDLADVLASDDQITAAQRNQLSGFVPEPSSLLLACFAGSACITRRRRRTSRDSAV